MAERISVGVLKADNNTGEGTPDGTPDGTPNGTPDGTRHPPGGARWQSGTALES